MTTYYDVLRRPLVTEKTNYQNSKLHQYVFEVAPDANKVMIKDAIENIFKVKVVRINVINVATKTKRHMRYRRTVHRRSSYKKAVVTLAPGDTIAVFEGVK